jgi:hypothetical protein
MSESCCSTISGLRFVADPIVRITMLADGVDDRKLSALLQKAVREAREKEDRQH